jgi:hypothetical protein
MAAISQAYSTSQAQFDDPTDYDYYEPYPPPDEFPNPNPNPNPDLALAAHTYTPGTQIPEDRNATFRNTVFGQE